MKKYIGILSLLAFASAVSAEIKMPKVFSDNMVLQAGELVKVWGTAEAGAEVRVEFAGQSKTAKAKANGGWSLLLNPMMANKNARTMTISENSQEAKRIENVLVGEVWVIGGQSNMEWRLVPTTFCDAAVKRANYPQIRYFQQDARAMSKTPQTDSPEGSKWIVCSPATAPSFSAVGFYFAERLTRDLDVPVALIYTPLGATAMMSWIPEKDFEKLEVLSDEMKKFKSESESYDYDKALAAHKAKLADFDAKVAKAKAEGKQPPSKSWDFNISPNPLSPRVVFRTPAYHFNAKVAPLGGFAVRGVLWYQGESDASGWQLEYFEEQFKILIDSWRENWNKPDMPFLFTQLASYGTAPETNWARARWAQYNASKNMKNVRMANIIDTGEEKDIHPRDKQEVGERLEKIALRDVYGINVSAYGPILKSVNYDNAVAYVNFNSDSPIFGKGEPRGFEVFTGGEWKPAAGVEILKNSVRLLSPDGKNIEGVRYLWESWALPNAWLFDSAGLPAVSFINYNRK